jgi:hypothetical protein
MADQALAELSALRAANAALTDDIDLLAQALRETARDSEDADLVRAAVTALLKTQAGRAELDANLFE